MKLLLDQDIYAITARYLRSLGHDVLTAVDLESSRASDEALLSMAQERGRIFVTRDRVPLSYHQPSSYLSYKRCGTRIEPFGRSILLINPTHYFLRTTGR